MFSEPSGFWASTHQVVKWFAESRREGVLLLSHDVPQGKRAKLGEPQSLYCVVSEVFQKANREPKLLLMLLAEWRTFLRAFPFPYACFSGLFQAIITADMWSSHMNEEKRPRAQWQSYFVLRGVLYVCSDMWTDHVPTKNGLLEGGSGSTK